MTKFGIIGTTVAAVAGATVIVVPTVVALTVRNVDPKAMELYKNSIEELKAICKIPHVSNQGEVKPDTDGDHLKGIRQHLKNKIKEYMGSDCAKTDDVGNVWFDIPATPGFENQKPIVLQAHMDMVWDSAGEAKEWDPLTHPVSEPVIETVEGKRVMHTKNWLTSLGADDGQGMAIMLSLAKLHDRIDHCPIRCLFTVDEETTTAGAMKLGIVNGEYNNFFKDFNYLANLDSPHGGQIVTTSAGIGNYKHTFTLPYVVAEEGNKYSTTIKLYDFIGGHSGEDVDSGRVSPIPLLCKELLYLRETSGDVINFQIARIATSAEAKNKIAKDITIDLVSNISTDLFDKMLSYDFKQVADLYPVETEAKLSVTEGPTNPKVISSDYSYSLLNGFATLPCGPMNDMRFEDGYIGGSGNIAPLSWKDETSQCIINFDTTYRFGSKKWCEDIKAMTDEVCDEWKYVFKNLYEYDPGAKTTPVWEEKENNKLCDVCVNAHKKLTFDVTLAKCHGALEASYFCNKDDAADLYQIAIGPTIMNEHNVKEQLVLEDYQHIHEVLVEMLKSFNI